MTKHIEPSKPTVLDRIDNLFENDFPSRARMMAITIVVTTATSLIAKWVDHSSDEFSVGLGLAIGAVTMVAYVFWYAVWVNQGVPLAAVVLIPRRLVFRSAMWSIVSSIASLASAKSLSRKINTDLVAAVNSKNPAQATRVLEQVRIVRLAIPSPADGVARDWLRTLEFSPAALQAIVAYANAFKPTPGIYKFGKADLNAPRNPNWKHAALLDNEVEDGLDGQFSQSLTSRFYPKYALLEPIGSNWNKDAKTGPSHLEVRHSIADVDGFHYRAVYLRRSTVVYKGGAVIVEDCTFLNCTFEIDFNEAGFEFAKEICLNLPGPTTYRRQ